jgi:hypothetical protein
MSGFMHFLYSGRGAARGSNSRTVVPAPGSLSRLIRPKRLPPSQQVDRNSIKPATATIETPAAATR